MVFIGDYSKYLEVPDDEFDNWLNLLTAPGGMDPFTEEQKREIKKQFSTCLVGTVGTLLIGVIYGKVVLLSLLKKRLSVAYALAFILLISVQGSTKEGMCE